MRDSEADFRNEFEQPIPEGIDPPRLFRVLIMPLMAPTETPGGIILPGATHEGNLWNQQLGKVAAVADYVGKNRNYRDIGWEPEKDNLKPGDLCMFSANNPQRYTFKGTNFVVVNDDAIMIGPIDPENIKEYEFGRFTKINMGGSYT